MNKKIRLIIIILFIIVTFLTIKRVTIGDNKIIKINTTWGEFLNLYMKDNPKISNYNPRQEISKDLKVRVVKKEYPNGFESKYRFYEYALITDVYDAQTGELLTTVGDYKDKK